MSTKNNVYLSYNKIAKWFDEHRSRDLFEQIWLDKAIELLKPHAKVLDLGCGMGEPIAAYFLEHNFDLVGVDGSKELIDLAQKRLPAGKFIIGDMRDIEINQKFDLIIAWHSFFHLTKQDQRKMFLSFSKYLNNNGILLFTSGHEEGEVLSDNGGEELYHASLSPEEYKLLLKNHGFILVDYKISDPDCGGATVWLTKFEHSK